MKHAPEVKQEPGIKFFGEVTASISHEVKNVLAVINEEAGLMEDLVLMAEKGRPLDTERIKALAGKVREQVARGNGIVKNLNVFAHTVDKPVDRVDLNEMLNLVARLAERRASVKGVTLQVSASSDRAMVTTNPFALENLIWSCVFLSMESKPVNRTITLSPDISGGRTVIRITGFSGFPEERYENFSELMKEYFSQALGFGLTFSRDSGEIGIILE